MGGRHDSDAARVRGGRWEVASAVTRRARRRTRICAGFFLFVGTTGMWLAGGLPYASIGVGALQPPRAEASLLEEKEAELARAGEEIDRLQDEIDAAHRKYREHEQKIHETRLLIDETTEEIEQAKRELGEKKKELETRLVASYKENHASFPFVVQVFFGSEDFAQVMATIPHLVKIVDADAELVDELNALKDRLEERILELAELRHELSQTMNELKGAREKLEELLTQAEKEYEFMEEEVAPLRAADALLKKAEASRREWVGRVGGSVMRLAQGFVFPVDGPHSFYDDWEQPRPDDRVHRGTDIMAARGASVVAAARGVIKSVGYGHKLGGTIIWLRGYNGSHYYYAHLDKILPGIQPGVEVEAGWPIGTVGDTGNAVGGSPHLHLQIHPGGGGPINPYPILRISD